MTDDQHRKVLFRVEGDEDDVYVETLWAYDRGDDHYQLDNSPFYAYGVSWEDIVHAPFNEDEGFPTFVRVVEKSGNRTVRVILARDARDDALTNALSQLECTWEGMYEKLLSVTIPPHVEIDVVVQALIESGLEWEYADPPYSEVHGSG